MSGINPFVYDFIQKTHPMPMESAQAIAQTFEPIQFLKYEYLLKKGQVSNDYYLLESGFIRAYTLDADGQEVTTNFYTDGQIVNDIASLFTRQPTQEFFQAITDCQLWRISFDQLQVHFHSNPDFREFGRLNLVKGFIQLKARMLANITQTAEERYDHLINTRPEVFQHAQLKHIASYLGITDTSLSRIRKK